MLRNYNSEFKPSDYGLNILTNLQLAKHSEYGYTLEDLVNWGGVLPTGMIRP